MYESPSWLVSVLIVHWITFVSWHDVDFVRFLSFLNQSSIGLDCCPGMYTNGIGVAHLVSFGVTCDELAIRWSPFFRDCIINKLIVEKSYSLLIFITHGKNILKIPKRHTPTNYQNDGQKKKTKRKVLIHKPLHRHDWATRIPLKNEGELRCSGRISKSRSTSGTHHVTLVINPVMLHEWGTDWFVIRTKE